MKINLLLFSVSHKIWVIEFYRKNAGFFMLIGFLLVGMGRPDLFPLFAGMAVRDASLLLSVFFLPFALYTIKTIRWGSGVFAITENSFFRQIAFLPGSGRLLLFMLLQAGLLLPLAPFFLLLLGKAVELNQGKMVCLISAFWFFLHLGPALHWLNIPGKPGDRINLKTGNGQIPRFAGWFCRDLFMRQPILLLSSKLLSLLLIAGSVVLFRKDVADPRLLSLALLFASFIHIGLLDELTGMENRLAFLRNLPMSFFSRILFSMKLIFPLLIPEILLCLFNFPSQTGFIFRLSAAAFFVSLVLLISQLRWIFLLFPERKSVLLPLLFFLFSFAIMFRIPPAAFAVCLLAASFALNHFFYHRSHPDYAVHET